MTNEITSATAATTSSLAITDENKKKSKVATSANMKNNYRAFSTLTNHIR
jgi:hypothetical protein